jgi:NAD(P)-dependent dehydrogenase (short-subunit alcohol dehydrogenase family)
MFQRTIDAFGFLNILVNNAGIQKPCPSDKWARTSTASSQ